MDFSIKSTGEKTALMTTRSGCIVIGVFENRQLTQAAAELDSAGEIKAALQSGDISGKPGTTLLLRNIKGVTAQRVLLVGLGKDRAIAEKDFSAAAKAVVQALSSLGAQDAVVALPLHEVKNRDLTWAVRSFVFASRDRAYRSDSLKSKKEPAQQGVRKIALHVPADQSSAASTALLQANAIADGMQLTRDLGNLPPNVCTPTYLANKAKELKDEFGFGIEVLDRRQMQSLKMGSFLAVAKGSDQPPKLIVIKHLGGKAKEAPIVLVGKGITFDSGGISLKPGGNMDEMKFDMCGAASVLGTFRAVGALKLKQNIIGVIPSCENMPSGHANKPGDILTSMSGQTIEVLNTDAEGRLILCDALTYAERFKPAALIDVATLTGACVTALGHHHSGLFTRHDDEHDKLAEELLAAGKAIGDTAWRMPLDDAYQEQLKSNFADVANIGGPPAGSVTAACFLERFTRKYTWAHLDIAGTAWKGGASKGATGRPVPLLTQFLLNRENRTQVTVAAEANIGTANTSPKGAGRSARSGPVGTSEVSNKRSGRSQKAPGNKKAK